MEDNELWVIYQKLYTPLGSVKFSSKILKEKRFRG